MFMSTATHGPGAGEASVCLHLPSELGSVSSAAAQAGIAAGGPMRMLPAEALPMAAAAVAAMAVVAAADTHAFDERALAPAAGGMEEAAARSHAPSLAATHHLPMLPVAAGTLSGVLSPAPHAAAALGTVPVAAQHAAGVPGAAPLVQFGSFAGCEMPDAADFPMYAAVPPPPQAPLPSAALGAMSPRVVPAGAHYMPAPAYPVRVRRACRAALSELTRPHHSFFCLHCCFELCARVCCLLALALALAQLMNLERAQLQSEVMQLRAENAMLKQDVEAVTYLGYRGTPPVHGTDAAPQPRAMEALPASQ